MVGRGALMPATAIVRLGPEHLPAVARFAQKLWPWPSEEAFYRWRFLDCNAFHHAYLALKDSEVQAMICAFERELLVQGEKRKVLDGFDWATLPEPQAGTMGFFVMQALLKNHPLPVLGYSGTPISMALRAKLGWQELEPVKRFMLPLASEKKGARGIAETIGAKLWFRPRRHATPRGGKVILTTGVGSEIKNLYEGDTGYGAVLLPRLDYLHWLLHGYAGVGHFLPLYFALEGELRGWVLARIYYEEGRCEAVIVECFAPRPTADLYTWMVSETLVRLTPFGPSKIRAAASCPKLIEALGRNRFLERRPIPLDYRSRGETPLPKPLHLTWNAADFAFRPYSRWDWAV